MSETAHAGRLPPRWGRIVVALLLFGVAFGAIEAAVVVYLRTIYEPIRARLYPGNPPGEVFAIVRPDQLEAEGKEALRPILVELVREAATLLMLAAVALAAARNFREWFAAFAVAFGLWDIFFYIFLRVFLDWPQSLFTWDLLFLLPVPWAGPVISPVIVSVSMIAAGTAVLWRECAERPIRIAWYHWTAVVVGGLTIIIAFSWDFRNIAGGGLPNPFNWPLFLLGEAVGIAGFLHAWRQGSVTIPAAERCTVRSRAR